VLETLIYHDATCCCGPSLAKRGLLSGRLDVNSDSIFVTYLEGRLRGVTNRLLDAVPLRCFGGRYRAERLHLCYKVDVALPLQDGDAYRVPLGGAFRLRGSETATPTLAVLANPGRRPSVAFMCSEE
jgi:hypothetical protein